MEMIKQEIEEIKKQVKDLREENDSNISTKKDIKRNTAKTRNKLAIMFIKLYFATLALSFAIPWSFNLCVYLITGNSQLFVSIKEIIMLITSALGGPLGFVIAFYFKNEK
jgi:hypothetical protein